MVKQKGMVAQKLDHIGHSFLLHSIARLVLKRIPAETPRRHGTKMPPTCPLPVRTHAARSLASRSKGQQEDDLPQTFSTICAKHGVKIWPQTKHSASKESTDIQVWFVAVLFRRTGEHLALLLLGSAVGAHNHRVVTLVRLQRDLRTDKPTRSAD